MWIYAGVIVLVATQTVASNLTYEDLEKDANETIQLPALYSCTNDTEICIWPSWRNGTQSPFQTPEKDVENGLNWVLLAMDGEAPALQFVVKVENRTLIFCSSFPGKCSANDTKMIHHLTKVIVEDGDKVIVKNITMALHNKSIEIVENVTMALHQESVETVDNITTALQNESVQIMENITMALYQESAKTVDNIQALVNTVQEQNNSYNKIISGTHALAEKCESASTNHLILIVFGINFLLTLPLQVKSIVDLLKHLFKCRRRSRKREDNP